MTYEYIQEVVGRASIGICRLNCSNVQLQTGLADELHDKAGDETRNLISVQEVEHILLVGIVKDDSICVAVKAAVAMVGNQGYARRRSLLRLDIVSPALIIECSKSRNVVLDNDSLEVVGANHAEELPELRRPHAIGTVNCEGRLDRASVLEKDYDVS